MLSKDNPDIDINTLWTIAPQWGQINKIFGIHQLLKSYKGNWFYLGFSVRIVLCLYAALFTLLSPFTVSHN